MIMDKVIVTGDGKGNVIVRSKSNPAYGYIRVQQRRDITNQRGTVVPKTVTALVPDMVKKLEKRGWKEGQEIPGKIIFKEQLNPFDFKNPENDYKIAGKTGVVCRIYGEPIYRKAFYEEDESVADSYILDADGKIMSHTNTDEIQAAYELLQKQTET